MLDVTGPLTCLWTDLNKEAKVSPEDVLLLILVLLHSISIERRKLVWAKMNTKLRSLGSEEYGERGTDLFGPGFLEKASKRLEVEKTLSKVTKHKKQWGKEAKLPGQSIRPVADPSQYPWHYSGTIFRTWNAYQILPGELETNNLNPLIWQVATGYPLALIREPRQGQPPRPIQFATELSQMISDIIQELEQVCDTEGQPQTSLSARSS
jgi:hypothetical protein